MNQHTLDIDPENPKQEMFQDDSTSTSDKRNTTYFMEAAALLTIWSILVINEGAIRFIGTNPATLTFDGGRPPNSVLFFASLGEVIFGMAGLFVGMAAFIFRWYSTTATKAAMIVQTLLGYFVFVVYVFLVPAFDASDLTGPRQPGLSLGQDKFIIVLGLLTSFHFCLALQGGQFVFFCRLICAGTGRDFLKQKSGNRMRAIFWNANLGLAGLWTLITGAIVHASVGSGKLTAPFVSPPNVGLLPGLTIATGFFMIAVASVGIVFAVIGQKAPGPYFLVCGGLYLLAYLNYTIAQFGVLSSGETNFGAPVALHGGLVFMVVFLGPYFVHQAGKESQSASA